MQRSKLFSQRRRELLLLRASQLCLISPGHFFYLFIFLLVGWFARQTLWDKKRADLPGCLCAPASCVARQLLHLHYLARAPQCVLLFFSATLLGRLKRSSIFLLCALRTANVCVCFCHLYVFVKRSWYKETLAVFSGAEMHNSPVPWSHFSNNIPTIIFILQHLGLCMRWVWWNFRFALSRNCADTFWISLHICLHPFFLGEADILPSLREQ